jgi:hypothetical protein
MVRTLLTVALLAGFAAPVSAGPISVFTQIWDVGNTGHDELFLSGPGSGGVLTTGGGVTPVITVPANQTSGSQPGVVGFWPILRYSDLAHYDASRGDVLTLPATPVKLYAEVWNGDYGGLTSQFRQVYVDAVISGTVGPQPGQNVLNWQFPNPPVQVDFGDTKVTLSYTPVQQPDGTPLIMFDDGSPMIGTPGTYYYPTLLTANVDVWRDPSLPTDPPVEEPPVEQPPVTGTPPGVPEPSSALLLAGLAFGGFAARVRAMRK